MLIRPILPRNTPFKLSFIRRLSFKNNLPVTHDNFNSSGLPYRAEAGTVTRMVRHLRASSELWDFDQLRFLLFENSDYPSRRILKFFRHLNAFDKALCFLRFLESDSRPLPPKVYASAIQGLLEICSKKSDWQKRFRILNKMSRKMMVPLTFNSKVLMIRCYGRAGMLHEAFGLYNEIHPHERYTFIRNPIIGAFLRTGRVSDALRLLREMFHPNSEVLPDEETADIVFGDLVWLENLRQGAAEDVVFDLVLKFGERGLFPNCYCLTHLMFTFCKRSKIDKAWDILHSVMNFRVPLEASCYHILLTGLGNVGDIQRMKLLFAEMKKDTHTEPNIMTLKILINHFCKLGKFDDALEMFNEMSSLEGINSDMMVYNCLFDALCRAKKQKEALFLMQRMDCSPNVSIWNSWIDAIFRAGDMDISDHLFDKMKEMEVSPDVETLNILVCDKCKHGRVDNAVNFLQEMQENGLKGDAYTYKILITTLCHTKNLDKVLELFKETLDEKLSLSTSVYSAMIVSMALAGRHEDACFVASEQVKSGIVLNTPSYNSLIFGYCKKKRFDRAYELLREMEESGANPNSVTYTIFIPSLCKIGDFQAAGRMARKMIDKNIKPTKIIYSSLIRGYCLNDMIDEAMDVFRGLSCESSYGVSTVIYNTLIKSLCKNGDVERAMCMLDRMKRDGVSSNSGTYTAILRSLRKMNDLKKAFELMDRMKEERYVLDFNVIGILTHWLSVVGETEKLNGFTASCSHGLKKGLVLVK